MFKEHRLEFLEFLDKYIDISNYAYDTYDYLLKENDIGIAGRKTRNAKITKADVFLSIISQLFTVIIADAISKPQYISPSKKLLVDIRFSIF